MNTDLKVDDILYDSWGYDMTLVDFYKVKGFSQSGKTVIVQSIKSKQTDGDSFQGRLEPLPDQYLDEEYRVKIKHVNGQDYYISSLGKQRRHTLYKYTNPVWFNHLD